MPSGRFKFAPGWVGWPRRTSGQCDRCGAVNVPVIARSTGDGWLCFNLGYCKVRRAFSKPAPWDPPADMVDPQWLRAQRLETVREYVQSNLKLVRDV